jgi:hypothetical protein
MRKITINAIVDIIMVIAFVPTIISGVVLYGILPEGGRFSGRAVFWGLTRNQWTGMHDVWGFVLAALIVLHLLLHWKFFRAIPVCFRRVEKGSSGD